MKAVEFFFVIIVLSFNVCAQLETPSRNLVDKFLNTTLNVIVDPISIVDKTLKEIVQSEWKLNKVKVINYSEYENLKEDTLMSFISIEEVQYDKKENSIYKMLIVSLGGVKDRYNDSKILFSIPISGKEEEEEYVYKIKPLIALLQNHIKTVKENPDLKKIAVSSYYNKNSQLLKDKILLVNEKLLEQKLQNSDYFKKIYPYKYKFTTTEEIEKAIENCEPDNVFMHTVAPYGNLGYRFYLYVIDVCNGTLYYTDFHHLKDKPALVLEEEIRKMVKK